MMKLLGFLFRYSPVTLLLAAVLASVGGIASTWLLTIFNRHLQGGITTESDTWTFFGLCAFIMVTLFAARLLVARLTLWSAFDLRLQIGRQWVGNPLPKLERQGNAKLLNAITRDVDVLSNSMRELPKLCVDVTITLVCFAYMAWLSWRLLLILIGFMTALTVIRGAQKKRHRKLADEAHAHAETLVGSFSAMSNGIKELKMNLARWNAFYTGELYQTSAKFRDASYRTEVLFAFIFGYSEIALFLLLAILMFGLPGFGAFPLSEVVPFTVAFLFVRAHMDPMLEAPQKFVPAQVALDNLEQLGVFQHRSSLSVGKLQRLTEQEHVAQSLERDIKASRVPDNPNPSLGFRGVEYEYEPTTEDGGFKVGPVDLNIAAGELVFVTGGNGSGKTTFAKVLCGLYEPHRGEIWLDDVRIDAGNRIWYAQQFGAVFSDSYLFSSLYGADDLPQTSKVVNEYLQELRLQDKVKFDQGRFSTIALSQGQKKRLALLVAYMEDRPFYLFDEWAADQDPEFRQVFYFRILPELKARGKTVVAITHDDRYYHVADRVLKFEAGTLVAGHEARTASALQRVDTHSSPEPAHQY